MTPPSLFLPTKHDWSPTRTTIPPPSRKDISRGLSLSSSSWNRDRSLVEGNRFFRDARRVWSKDQNRGWVGKSPTRLETRHVQISGPRGPRRLLQAREFLQERDGIDDLRTLWTGQSRLQSPTPAPMDVPVNVVHPGRSPSKPPPNVRVGPKSPKAGVDRGGAGG